MLNKYKIEMRIRTSPPSPQPLFGHVVVVLMFINRVPSQTKPNPTQPILT